MLLFLTIADWSTSVNKNDRELIPTMGKTDYNYEIVQSILKFFYKIENLCFVNMAQTSKTATSVVLEWFIIYCNESVCSTNMITQQSPRQMILHHGATATDHNPFRYKKVIKPRGVYQCEAYQIPMQLLYTVTSIQISNMNRIYPVLDQHKYSWYINLGL